MIYESIVAVHRSKYLETIEKIQPTLDKQHKFIFFYNYRVCSTSIQNNKKGLCRNQGEQQ